MNTEMKIKTHDKLTGKNEIYEHTITTDSVQIELASNTTSESNTDKTFVIIKTLNDDSIVINQHKNTISINGVKITLNK